MSEEGNKASPSRPLSIRSVTIHDISHARAALSVAAELQTPVILQSAPGAASYLGATFFQEFIATAAEEFPAAHYTAILDCGTDSGAALMALKAGTPTLSLNISGQFNTNATSSLASIASQNDLQIMKRTEPSLDLSSIEKPADAIRNWLRN